MITDLTKLNRDQIVYLLEETGYLGASDEIFSTSYVSTNNHSIKYKIKYDADGIMETGHIFISIDDSGKLVADY